MPIFTINSCIISIVNLKCTINRYIFTEWCCGCSLLIIMFNTFLYSCLRNEDTDINRSKLLLSGFIGQATSNKYDDFTESFWGSRNSIENQTRQHYLARNRYIAEQSLRLPYPSVYGTQTISKYFAQVLVASLFSFSGQFDISMSIKIHLFIIVIVNRENYYRIID